VTVVRWTVLVPVKRLETAKTRLAPAVAAPSAPPRAELALALARDTVAAALACPVVARVLVVTSDDAAEGALTALGAAVVSDVPEAGLDRALGHAADLARDSDPGCGLAALSGDLPALRPGELTFALNAAAALPRAVVADEASSGTVLLTAGPGFGLRPAYGEGSLARHVSRGAAVLALDGVARLRRDVDTPGDLHDAASLGLGPATAALLDRLVPPSGSGAGDEAAQRDGGGMPDPRPDDLATR
jgi:2-phospho-L-lactate/phosphoenolpyruvate guanylyltransferase